MKRVSFEVDEETHRELRLAAADRGLTIKALLLGSLEGPVGGFSLPADSARPQEAEPVGHKAFKVCEDPKCKMKIRHAEH